MKPFLDPVTCVIIIVVRNSIEFWRLIGLWVVDMLPRFLILSRCVTLRLRYYYWPGVEGRCYTYVESSFTGYPLTCRSQIRCLRSLTVLVGYQNTQSCHQWEPPPSLPSLPPTEGPRTDRRPRTNPETTYVHTRQTLLDNVVYDMWISKYQNECLR